MVLPVLARIIPFASLSDCPTSWVGHDPIRRDLERDLFAEKHVPCCSVLDAGCNDGVDSCFYAALAPNRTVHAIDPSARNIAAVRANYKQQFANILPMVGGLGNVARTLHIPPRHGRTPGQISIASPLSYAKRDSLGPRNIMAINVSKGQPFDVERLDDLFLSRWPTESLGFAHLDVEGSELEVLQGGERTISRDFPIFTVEVAIHKDPEYTRALLSFIDRLDYDALLIEEEVGAPLDLRNLLCLPRRRGLSSQIKHSPVFRSHLDAGRIVRVGAESVFRHAYPCCKAGGTCCPSPSSCCSLSAVPAAVRLQRFACPAVHTAQFRSWGYDRLCPRR